MSKISSDRSGKLVQDLALQAGNDICADCKTKSPRWASHNLGIFLCVYCASVHRKIGTHISKVKSITMDSWTKEQAENMKNIGNVKSNAIFCPDEFRHPPPPPLMDATRDNELEQYIRSKYEYKKFISKSALVASKLGPSRSLRDVSPATRSSTAPPPKVTPASPPRPSTAGVSTPQRSVTQPPPPSISQPTTQQQTQQQQQPGVWADLVSLQGPSSSSTLPLQIQSPASQQYMQQQSQPTGMGVGMGSAYQPPPTVTMGMNGMGSPMQMNSPGLQQPQGYMFAPQGQQQYGQPQQQFIPQQQQQQFGQQQFGQQFGQQQGMMSPTPQYQSQMMSPTPQYNLSTTPSGMPGMSTTPGMQGMQGMSTTPSFQMTPSPNMFAGQMGGGQMGMGISPSPNYGMAMQQTNPFQQQQQQPQMQLPPMGGGAWPQPMYGQQQQQQQPMMQQGQWMAM